MSSYLPWDVEMFISEVKKYPELWDVNSEEYRFRERKQRAWGEVAKVFVEDYDDLSAKERDDLFRKLLGKWRNIKDSYVRHTKRKCKSKKGYLYANHLTFLGDVYKPSDTASDEEEQSSTWPSDDDDSSERAKRRKTDIEFVEASPAEALYAVDEDKSFFDSLLPAVREFTIDQKLEFRSDLINLIKMYRKTGRRTRSELD